MRSVSLLALLPLILACRDSGSPELSTFMFTDIDPAETFVFQLTDPDLADHARRILSGDETRAVHVMGTVVKERAAYNPSWSYHLDPASIGFFEIAMEVCDATMQYVEKNLDDVGGAFLPNGTWCPWSSKLVGELVRAE